LTSFYEINTIFPRFENDKRPDFHASDSL
jgi:hypothetical protein